MLFCFKNYQQTCNPSIHPLISIKITSPFNSKLTRNTETQHFSAKQKTGIRWRYQGCTCRCWQFQHKTKLWKHKQGKGLPCTNSPETLWKFLFQPVKQIKKIKFSSTIKNDKFAYLRLVSTPIDYRIRNTNFWFFAKLLVVWDEWVHHRQLIHLRSCYSLDYESPLHDGRLVCLHLSSFYGAHGRGTADRGHFHDNHSELSPHSFSSRKAATVPEFYIALPASFECQMFEQARNTNSQCKLQLEIIHDFLSRKFSSLLSLTVSENEWNGDDGRKRINISHHNKTYYHCRHYHHRV